MPRKKHDDDSIVVCTTLLGQPWTKIRCSMCGRLSFGAKRTPLMSDVTARIAAETAAVIEQQWKVRDGAYVCDNCDPKYAAIMRAKR